MQNKAQYDKVRSFIDEAKAKGTVVKGGEDVPGAGYFITPTIITGLADDDRLVSEEQFGPVMPVLGYDDLEDAIKRANDSAFGLGATIWTSDIDRASRSDRESSRERFGLIPMSHCHSMFPSAAPSSRASANRAGLKV